MNEITLKKHLTDLKLINPTTELQKIGEKGKVHNDEEEPNKLQSIVWKSAKFDSEDIVIRFFNLKKYPDEIPQFLSYLNVFQTLKITECDRIPEFYGICYEQEKDDSNVSFGLMFRYLEGDTLREYLKKNPKLKASDKFQLLIEVAKIVEYLHKQGVISRSLNPDSLVVNNNKIYLTDFKHSTKNEKTNDFMDNDLIRYNAPEVFIQKSERIFENSITELYYDITTKVDIWSIGTIMLEILSGVPAFESKADDPTLLLLAFMDELFRLHRFFFPEEDRNRRVLPYLRLQA